jgi:hypothetical protein
MSESDAPVPERQPKPVDRATLLIAAGASAVAFSIGFNYGAFDAIFFSDVFRVWVVATVVFVGSLISPLPPHTWPRRLVLLVPTLWLLASWIDSNLDVANSDKIVTGVTFVVTFIALPFVGWFLVTAINTDFADLPRTHKGAVLGAIAVFLAVGALLGARNDAILTCEDFKVSGNDLPVNCVTTSQP